MNWSMSMKPALALIFGISVLALVVAFWLIQWVMAKDTGTDEMRKISDAIKAGAEAFLRRQNYTIVMLASALAALIFILYAFVRGHNEHDPASPMVLAICTTSLPRRYLRDILSPSYLVPRMCMIWAMRTTGRFSTSTMTSPALRPARAAAESLVTSATSGTAP